MNLILLASTILAATPTAAVHRECLQSLLHWHQSCLDYLLEQIEHLSLELNSRN